MLIKIYCKLISRQRFHALEDRIPRARPNKWGPIFSPTSSPPQQFAKAHRFTLEENQDTQDSQRTRTNPTNKLSVTIGQHKSWD